MEQGEEAHKPQLEVLEGGLEIDRKYMEPFTIGYIPVTREKFGELLDSVDFGLRKDLSDIHRIFFGVLSRPKFLSAPVRIFPVRTQKDSVNIGVSYDEQQYNISVDPIHLCGFLRDDADEVSPESGLLTRYYLAAIAAFSYIMEAQAKGNRLNFPPRQMVTYGNGDATRLIQPGQENEKITSWRAASAIALEVVGADVAFKNSREFILTNLKSYSDSLWSWSKPEVGEEIGSDITPHEVGLFSPYSKEELAKFIPFLVDNP